MEPLMAASTERTVQSVNSFAAWHANQPKLGRTDDPLQLPHGEAADVQVDIVQSGHRAVVRELDRELQLVPCNRQFAHRARGADACTAPCAIRPAGGELPSSDRCSGFFAEEGFVRHLADPKHATPKDAGAPCLSRGGGLNQMPRGATPAASTLQARGR